MPVLLRKRLACHYCGKRLNTVRRDGSKIHCDSCQADNFIDADNNIVDVPAEEAARWLNAGPLNEIESDSDVFCSTCLTNQSFYVRALADYLPDESDPKYREFERVIPEFKKDLDLRYPRCCANCAPRVEAKIQQANYTAKADHLRRLVHRKHDRRRTPEVRLRSLLISAAGLGHAVSLVLQLAWHAAASQHHTDHIISGIMPSQCLQQWPVPAQCADYAASLVPMSLLVGLLCIWWNPKWQHRLSGSDGRLRGLRKYYTIQLFIMVLRFLAWVVIRDVPVLQRRSSILHTLCLGLLIMTSLYSSFGIIRVDTTPLVDWHQFHQPLISQGQFRPPPQQSHHPPFFQAGSQFSIDTLAAPSQPIYEPWRPPTPPPNGDGMDWSPSTHAFDPQPRIPRPKFEQPSPFHGTLPAAPTRGSIHSNRPAPPPQKKALGLPPGFFGLSKNKAALTQNKPAQPVEHGFAPARFFVPEREADTGLENIFDQVFSVNDPLEHNTRQPALSARQHGNAQVWSDVVNNRGIGFTRLGSGHPSAKMFICCTSVVGLAMSAMSLFNVNRLANDTTAVPSTILPYTAIIFLVHILEEIIFTRQASLRAIALPASEAVIIVGSHFLVPHNGSPYVAMWNKLVLGSFCTLLMQEIYRFCQLQTIPVSEAAAAQMRYSIQRAVQQQHVQPDQKIYEENITSHPSPQPRTYHSSIAPVSSPQRAPLQHAQPHQIQQRANQRPLADYTNSIRKRDSDESISSVTSIQTTSTAPGWKTPKNESRTFDWQSQNSSNVITPRRQSASIARGLVGLSLSNDFGIGSGSGIAGPRTRNSGNTGSGNGRYR